MDAKQSRVHLTDAEILNQVPESVIRAAERADAYLIESDSMAFVWLEGRCALSLLRKNDSTEGFREKIDIIFHILHGMAGASGGLDQSQPDLFTAHHPTQALFNLTSIALGQAIQTIRRLAEGEEVDWQEDVQRFTRIWESARSFLDQTL